LSGLAEVDKQRIGVMGFSLGGIAIASFAARDFETPEGLNFKAAVTVYGHCSSRSPGTPPYPGDPKFPWLIILGEKERESNQVACRSLQERSGVTYTLIGKAYHGFDDPKYSSMRTDRSGNQMLYDAAATKKAQGLVKDFFQQHLVR
jgi:dienelactone hydrolase